MASAPGAGPEGSTKPAPCNIHCAGKLRADTAAIPSLLIAAPGRPELRIVDLDERAASQFTVLVGLTAFVASFNKQLGQVSGGMFLSLNYTQGQTALGAVGWKDKNGL